MDLSASFRARDAYKRLLQLARRLPTAADHAKARSQIRAAFRASAAERDPAAIAELLRTAQEKLSYLRMVTPRLPEEASGRSTLSVVSGSVVQGPAERRSSGGAANSSYGPGSLDPDSVRTHQQQLRRFQFGDRMVRPTGPTY
jgi:hypothetical protein